MENFEINARACRNFEELREVIIEMAAWIDSHDHD